MRDTLPPPNDGVLLDPLGREYPPLARASPSAGNAKQARAASKAASQGFERFGKVRTIPFVFPLKYRVKFVQTEKFLCAAEKA